MHKIDKILVPNDLSAHSRGALDYALWLGGIHGAELVLLHVVEPLLTIVRIPVPGLNLPTLEAEIRNTSREQIETLRREVVGDTLPSRVLVREGTPFVEIIRAATEEAVDLIVIATHGHSGLKHLLMGSTAENVVRKAPCAVLTHRCGPPEFVLP